MQSWSVALPENVYLRASPHLGHKPPSWRGSSLRRWQRLTMALLVCAIVGLLIYAAFKLDTALAPFRSGSIQTTGTVTSQEPHATRYEPTCTLGIAFTLNGQQLHTTVDSGRACSASLRPGEQVQLTLNPDNPGDVAVLGHGYPREFQWRVVIFILIAAGALGIRLLKLASSYRRTKRLFTDGTRWLELTATVQARTKLKDRTIFSLDALDTTGLSQIFTMTFRDEGQWRPEPQPGDTLDFALLANGTAHAVISIEGKPRLRLVKLSAPSNFELRAAGL